MTEEELEQQIEQAMHLMAANGLPGPYKIAQDGNRIIIQQDDDVWSNGEATIKIKYEPAEEPRETPYEVAKKYMPEKE